MFESDGDLVVLREEGSVEPGLAHTITLFNSDIHYCCVFLRDTTFQSSAYGKRENVETSIDGRVMFDMLPYMFRNHKLSSYSLNSVSAELLGQQKEDVHYSIISDLQVRRCCMRSDVGAVNRAHAFHQKCGRSLPLDLRTMTTLQDLLSLQLCFLRRTHRLGPGLHVSLRYVANTTRTAQMKTDDDWRCTALRMHCCP